MSGPAPGLLVALVRQAVGEEVLLALGQQHLVGAAGEPRVGGDGAGRLGHGGVELVVGHAAHGQADGGGLGPGDDPTGVHHLLGPADPDAPGQALAHAPRRAHGPLAVGVGEAGRLGGDDVVARQRQLQGARVAVAVDGGDHRLRQRLDELQRLGLVARRRGPLAGLDRLQVVAGRERPAGAPQHDGGDRVGGGGQRLEVGPQLHEQRRAQRVERLGPLQGERGHGVLVVPGHEIGHDALLTVGGRPDPNGPPPPAAATLRRWQRHRSAARRSRSGATAPGPSTSCSCTASRTTRRRGTPSSSGSTSHRFTG